MRYTSPTSRSAMRALVAEADGYYSYWETGRRATLRELLVNEGLAVQVSRRSAPATPPGSTSATGAGSTRASASSSRCSMRAVGEDLDRAGLGLRLRYLSGGMSDEARTVRPRS